MSKQRKPTCGAVYQAVLDTFCQSVEDVRLFAPGFICGQMEKVYLGAAHGAMFRPQPDIIDWMFKTVEIAANIYQLHHAMFLAEGEKSDKVEIWVTRDRKHLGAWLRYEVNSPEWHRVRGMICGVPDSEIDEEFHTRLGYSEPCDRPTGT